MLSSSQRTIIIRALQYRQRDGENPAEAVKNYTRLTAEEQAAVLAAVGPVKESPTIGKAGKSM